MFSFEHRPSSVWYAVCIRYDVWHVFPTHRRWKDVSNIVAHTSRANCLRYRKIFVFRRQNETITRTKNTSKVSWIDINISIAHDVLKLLTFSKHVSGLPPSTVNTLFPVIPINHAHRTYYVHISYGGLWVCNSTRRKGYPLPNRSAPSHELNFSASLAYSVDRRGIVNKERESKNYREKRIDARVFRARARWPEPDIFFFFGLTYIVDRGEL